MNHETSQGPEHRCRGRSAFENYAKFPWGGVPPSLKFPLQYCLTTFEVMDILRTKRSTMGGSICVKCIHTDNFVICT